MKNFKVGDRVIYTGLYPYCSTEEYIGKKGYIESFRIVVGENRRAKVIFDDEEEPMKAAHLENLKLLSKEIKVFDDE